MAIALFIGRFQPMHNGHLQIIKQISKEYEKVIIGIGSSEIKYSEDNPWDIEEREEMIRDVMKDENITNFEIVHIPDFNEDDEWVKYMLKHIEFDDIYSGNEWTKQLLMHADCHVCDVERIDNISSTEIREKLKNKESIRDLVPKAVYNEISGI